MPRVFVPHKSGVHRAACYALYRALLRQQRTIPAAELEGVHFSERIRRVFQRNASLLGHTATTTALNLGYKTLELLQVDGLRPRVLQQLAEIYLPARRPRRAPATPAEPAPVPTEPPRPKHSVLDRPYKNISGRRRVPYLVDACRFPFLRIKKPQPKILSYLIRRSSEAREKRHLQSVYLRKLITDSADEDEWDKILSEHHGVGTAVGEDGDGLKDVKLDSAAEVPEIDLVSRALPSLAPHMAEEKAKDKAQASEDAWQTLNFTHWTTAPRAALVEIQDRHREVLAKRVDMAAKMARIVVEEKKLAEKERLERRDQKHQRYKERRRLREAAEAEAARGEPNVQVSV